MGRCSWWIGSSCVQRIFRNREGVCVAAMVSVPRIHWVAHGRIGGTWIPPAAALGGAVS